MTRYNHVSVFNNQDLASLRSHDCEIIKSWIQIPTTFTLFIFQMAYRKKESWEAAVSYVKLISQHFPGETDERPR